MNTPSAPASAWLRWLAVLALAFGAASVSAQQEVDPPARVASLSQVEGSVALAPAGETDWTDAVPNRPITRGDRLWTDRGSRAELHLGSAMVHLDGQTFLEIADLDDDVLQARLNEGSVNARVRELLRGENFEIDTPQLAFRAARPGDYRIDVDPAQGTTRVAVRSGTALVYGANGIAQELAGGQVVTFAGTDLERVAVHASLPQDGFDRWAADRNRAEDQSIAARHIPRDVVGYHQLDPYGSWAQDASYGAVWYPRVTIADWAPYRYGHWEFIAPWGWTWIDDAPWGFAPFHYGRWAMIGSRWAWVPGRLGPRPVYAPALVMFVGGSGGVSFNLSIGSDPGIGWFPLGPGEAWRPFYRHSPRYVTGVNRYVVINNRDTRNHFYVNQRHPSAVTSVRVEDFSRGRPVHRHWRRVDAAELGRVRIAAQPALPEPRRMIESRPTRQRAMPPPTLSAAPTPVQPAPGVPGVRRRDGADFQRPPLAVTRPQQREQERVQESAAREQERAQREQERARRDMQVQQDRAQRDQQVQILRQQDEQRRQQQVQRETDRALRQQERAVHEQERARRGQQVQQERLQREQQIQTQGQQERVLRQQQLQERAARQQQQAQEQAIRQQQQAQEHAQRQQQAALEQAARQQQQLQQRALRQPPPQVAAPGAQAPAREGRGRGRPERDLRDDNRSQGGDEGRGRGRGG